MIFPPYTWNGNTVTEYGRLFFIVSSNSRKGLLHFVDLEGGTYLDEEGKEHRWRNACTCESFKYGLRPCRHISACFHAIAAWAGVREAIREEWADRLMFLLSMGHSFVDALQSPSLKELRTPKPVPVPQPQPKPEDPQRTVRRYVLLPRNETARTDPKNSKRRLPSRVRRDPA